jgi:hypothetical protein
LLVDAASLPTTQDNTAAPVAVKPACALETVDVEQERCLIIDNAQQGIVGGDFHARVRVGAGNGDDAFVLTGTALEHELAVRDVEPRLR